MQLFITYLLLPKSKVLCIVPFSLTSLFNFFLPFATVLVKASHREIRKVEKGDGEERERERERMKEK